VLANAAVAWASLAVLAFAEEGADPEQSAQRLTSGGGAGVVLRFAGFYGPDSPQTRQLISFVRRGWAPIPGALERFFFLRGAR
jgi:hypothetical protein